jgi:hypothetical protein
MATEKELVEGFERVGQKILLFRDDVRRLLTIIHSEFDLATTPELAKAVKRVEEWF